MAFYVLLLLRRKKKIICCMPFFSPTAQFANENNEGNKAQIQTLRENIFFFSVSIFKDKMTTFILLQQLDL